MAVTQTALLAQIVEQAVRANPQHGFIYLNNPKVGCSTIKRSLWLAMTGQTPADLKRPVHVVEGSPFVSRLTDPVAVRQAFIFSFVRNPFQRIVSAYLNKVQMRTDKVWSGFATRRGWNPETEVSFDGFVERLSGVPPEEQDPHWRAQHLNILYPFVRPNLIGDLDSLDRVLPQVLARVASGQAKVVQGRRHGTAARQVWSGFFGDKATLDRVLTLYAGDFAAFGYAPSLTADPACQRAEVWSDHGHDGLAKVVAYWNAPGPQRFHALNAVEAADGQGALRDWILQQRLRHPRQHHSTLDDLVAGHAAQIAAGPAYLRRVVAARGQG